MQYAWYGKNRDSHTQYPVLHVSFVNPQGDRVQPALQFSPNTRVPELPPPVVAVLEPPAIPVPPVLLLSDVVPPGAFVSAVAELPPTSELPPTPVSPATEVSPAELVPGAASCLLDEHANIDVVADIYTSSKPSWDSSQPIGKQFLEVPAFEEIFTLLHRE